MSFALLFLYLMLNMFRMLIHPSSGACDLCAELFQGLHWFGLMCVGFTWWYGCGGLVSICRLKHCFSLWCGICMQAEVRVQVCVCVCVCVCVYTRAHYKRYIMCGVKYNNNNIYLLQLGCYKVAVIILHVYKTWNRLLLKLSREGYMRSM